MVTVASLHYSFATAAGAGHTPSGMKPSTVAALLPSDASTCANQYLPPSTLKVRTTSCLRTQLWVPASCSPLPGTQQALEIKIRRASSTARYTISRAFPRACPMAGSEYVSVESSLQARSTAYGFKGASPAAPQRCNKTHRSLVLRACLPMHCTGRSMRRTSSHVTHTFPAKPNMCMDQ